MPITKRNTQRPFVSKHGQVIRKCRIPGTVAFTFDDGPSFYTDYILHELAQFNATATFFLDTSSWLTEENHSGYWESLVRRMVEDGHLIGLTTESCDGGSPNYDETKHALADARERIGRIFISSTSSSGRHPMYVRAPPECTMQNGCVEKLTLDGQRLVFPGINSEDPYDDHGRDMNSTSLLNDLESADPEKDSFLIRMHDSEQTALNVGSLVHSFVSKGFKPTTVGDCIGDHDHFMYLQPSQSSQPPANLGVKIGNSWNGSFSQLRWVGFPLIPLLEFMALAALFWTARRYRKIRSHMHIVR
ncbi:chitin deacetylase precursor [Colletotrichum chrysophilum]|uniref:Chitin deacetylase n=1 Tax=Colletotrichum chrysophilum TaxID=1836956 RepID=A0AAD9EPP2_9PEZI|nr:chitin deacetylase precursor [Colletotrichum chrysophilum]